MKYVALMIVDQPKLWSEWHYGPTAKYFKSPIATDRTVVEKWLRDEKKKYPNARINKRSADRQYIIYTTIIAFDDEETENLEMFLDEMRIKTS